MIIFKENSRIATIFSRQDTFRVSCNDWYFEIVEEYLSDDIEKAKEIAKKWVNHEPI